MCGWWMKCTNAIRISNCWTGLPFLHCTANTSKIHRTRLKDNGRKTNKEPNMNVMNFNRFNHLLFALLLGVGGGAGAQAPNTNMLYTYTLSGDHTAEAYDEAVTVACIQGILNRSA